MSLIKYGATTPISFALYDATFGITPITGQTNVVSSTVTVTNAGTGYTSVPTIAFAAPPAGGATATGTATLSGTTIASITVTYPGSGYTSGAPAITITGGGGSSGAAMATVVNQVTVTVARQAGIFSAGSGTISEIGNGIYEYTPTTSDTATGVTNLYIQAACPSTRSNPVVSQLVNFDPTTNSTGGLPTIGTGTGQITLTSGQVQTQYPLQKNAVYNNFKFYMVSSTDHVTPLTGATVAGQTALDGGAFTNLTNSVTELSNGWYKVNLAAADVNGTDVALRFTATGGDPVPIKLALAA